LWIDNLKLAKLALCRRPTQLNFTKEITQIAKYVGVERQRLVKFIETVENAQVAHAAAQQKAVQRRQVWRTRGVALAFGFAALFLILLGTFMFQPPEEIGATLIVTDGQAVISRVEKLFYIVPRLKGQVVVAGEDVAVKVGDTIALGEAESAKLRLADGSTVRILANTKLIIDDLAITEDTYQVRLRMLSGSTTHYVVHKLEAGDVYEVATPSSTISVRGTIFTVQVLSPEWTYVACTEGVVAVVTGDYSVELHAGEEVYAELGQPLEVQAIGGATPENAPAPLPDGFSVPALPAPPAQEAPASGDSDAEGGASGAEDAEVPGPEGASPMEQPPPGGETPPEDGGKQVPGKPPGTDPDKPQPGGEPPGQTKDKTNKGKKSK
jgi:hypothetical protein